MADTKADDKSGLSDLEKWRKRVELARKVRTDWERENQVKRSEKYFLGEQHDRGVRAADLVLNHFLSTIKTILPNLVVQEPTYLVRPKGTVASPSLEEKARAAEGLLMTVATHDQNLKKSSKLALVQSFFRLGVLKIVYDPKLEPNPQAGEPIYMVDAMGQVIKGSDGLPQQMKDPLTGEAMVEPNEVVSDEIYRWDWVDASNMLLPDEGPDSTRWTWVGEEVIVPLEDAQADVRFPQDMRDKMEANVSAKPDQTRRKPYRAQDVADKFRYVEVYDLKRKRLLIWADDLDSNTFLYNDVFPDGISNHPYAILNLGDPIIAPDPCPWPLPVTKSWLEPAREYNIRRQQIMEGAKRSARKGVYFDGTFDDDDEATKLLQNPDDMTFAKVKDPKLIPVMLDTPALNQAIFADVGLLMNDWRIITGQTGARLATAEKSTATEASYVERAANLRDSDAQSTVLFWFQEAGTKMFQRIQQTLTTNVYIKMRGLSDHEIIRRASMLLQQPPEVVQQLLEVVPQLRYLFKTTFGEDLWKPVTREELIFDAEVKVMPGSMRPRNLQLEKAEWLEFLTLLGQFPQLALSPALMEETAKKYETISERMVNELVALAQVMVSVNANQAGHGDKGAAGGGQSSTAGEPTQNMK
jgi:hypothetical protein